MRRQYILFLLVFLATTHYNARSQGLKFKGNSYLIQERTSYNVFNNSSPVFKDFLTIDFDILCDTLPQVGYLFRIKTQNPDLTFNLAYDSQGNNIAYHLNLEGKNRLITMSIPKKDYTFSQWSKLQLHLDLINGLISFSIGDHSQTEKLNFPKYLETKVLFGCSDYFIDIPSFSIRNLKISGKNVAFEYPLSEHTGSVVYPSKGDINGHINNPIWLINDAYYWKYTGQQTSKKVAGFNFNQDKQEIYYFNQDSLILYNMINGKISTIKYKNECPIDFRLGDNFLNPSNNSMIVYETYKTLSKDVMMAEYNFDNKTWSVLSKDKLPTERHHHGRFFDQKNNRFIIFGGFGNLLYTNDFYSFDLNTKTWSKLNFKGDIIHPRYFLSMGYLEKTNSLYIFGGMGNESGEYNVGRKYFYDLYKVDLNNYTIKKLWEIDWKKEDMVPIKSMIINEEKQTFITFCYPEHYSNTFLKLYEFSLENGHYSKLGDSIPIRSEKIGTNAQLFLDKKFSKLYAVVQEFDNDDIGSKFKLYTLSYPPVSFDSLQMTPPSGKSGRTLIYIIPVFILITILTSIIYWRFRRRQDSSDLHALSTSDENQSLPEQEIKKTPNTIFLFGKFSVINRSGKEIEYMLSARLKHAFLLILQHSANGGITSKDLTDTLWDDRNNKKAKNIRGVTINGLRKVLEELDGISLIYEKSTYRIEISSKCYCDYLSFLTIINEKQNQDNSVEFIRILSNGEFLKNNDEPLFDTWKALVEDKLESELKQSLRNCYERKNYQTVSVLSKIILDISPLSDFALSYYIRSSIKLNKENLAEERYQKFANTYKQMMGEDYKTPYEKFIR